MATDPDFELAVFADQLLGDWDAAMQRFFEVVERKRKARGLTVGQVREALDHGYGDEVGDAWAEWDEEDD